MKSNMSLVFFVMYFFDLIISLNATPGNSILSRICCCSTPVPESIIRLEKNIHDLDLVDGLIDKRVATCCTLKLKTDYYKEVMKARNLIQNENTEAQGREELFIATKTRTVDKYRVEDFDAFGGSPDNATRNINQLIAELVKDIKNGL